MIPDAIDPNRAALGLLAALKNLLVSPAPLIYPAITFGAAALAIGDRARLRRTGLAGAPQVNLSPNFRHRKRALLTLAWALYLALAVVMLRAAGAGGLQTFVLSTSALWAVQLLALGALLESGAAWAGSVARDPFAPAASGTSRAFTMILNSCVLIPVAGLAWTAVLFIITRNRLPASDASLLNLGVLPPLVRWGFLILSLSLAPVLEEILFRHYLLYRLAARLKDGPAPRAAPIVLTAMAWAACHTTPLIPFGVKFAQVAPFGVALGYLAWRRGLGAAIIAHWIFNLALIPLALLVKG